MALTATAIGNAKPKDKFYEVADAQGLCLLVNPRGGKLWRVKYRINTGSARSSVSSVTAGSAPPRVVRTPCLAMPEDSLGAGNIVWHLNGQGLGWDPASSCCSFVQHGCKQLASD